jgi:hypothetical protein
MARFGSSVFPVIRDVRAVQRVAPAERPTLGVAPDGTWIWTSLVKFLGYKEEQNVSKFIFHQKFHYGI